MCWEKRRSKQICRSRSLILMGGKSEILSPITLRMEAGLALQSLQVGSLFIPEIDPEPITSHDEA